MPKYRVISREVDAVQFTGENWIEMVTFCGEREDGEGHKMMVFTPIGTYIIPLFSNGAKAELWMQKHMKLGGVNVNDWVVKGEEGFFSISDEMFKQTFESFEEVPA